MTDEIKSLCLVCQKGIHWISCPTGGWWAHDEHPADNHDAASRLRVLEDIDEDGHLVTVDVRHSERLEDLLESGRREWREGKR